MNTYEPREYRLFQDAEGGLTVQYYNPYKNVLGEWMFLRTWRGERRYFFTQWGAARAAKKHAKKDKLLWDIKNRSGEVKNLGKLP